MIVFENQGEIDLRVITTFGVCDKVGKNPIGYFGTGLKYAIAVLLREKVKVVLWKGTQRFEFYTRRQKLRTTEADWIVMKGPMKEHVLAFTTQLGKNWEVWQALRELMCNTLDEGGTYEWVTDEEELTVCKGRTVFILEGTVAEEAFRKRDTIILGTTPLHKHYMCEIHEGDGNWIYYRGIRVHKNEKPALYNYNILSEQRLTEDRTLDGVWGAHYAIAAAVADCEDGKLVDAILKAPKERMEHEVDFSYASPSRPFIRAVRDSMSSFEHINPTSIGVFHSYSSSYGMTLPHRYPTEEEAAVIRSAQKVWENVGAPIQKYPCYMATNIGDNVDAHAYGGAMYLNPELLKKDLRDVARVMFECFMKLHYQLTPLSAEAHRFLVQWSTSLAMRINDVIRDMQQFLPDCMMPDGADPCKGYQAVDKLLRPQPQGTTDSPQQERGQQEHSVVMREVLGHGDYQE